MPPKKKPRKGALPRLHFFVKNLDSSADHLTDNFVQPDVPPLPLALSHGTTPQWQEAAARVDMTGGDTTGGRGILSTESAVAKRKDAPISAISRRFDKSAALQAAANTEEQESALATTGQKMKQCDHSSKISNLAQVCPVLLRRGLWVFPSLCSLTSLCFCTTRLPWPGLLLGAKATGIVRAVGMYSLLGTPCADGAELPSHGISWRVKLKRLPPSGRSVMRSRSAKPEYWLRCDGALRRTHVVECRPGPVLPAGSEATDFTARSATCRCAWNISGSALVAFRHGALHMILGRIRSRSLPSHATGDDVWAGYFAPLAGRNGGSLGALTRCGGGVREAPLATATRDYKQKEAQDPLTHRISSLDHQWVACFGIQRAPDAARTRRKHTSATPACLQSMVALIAGKAQLPLSTFDILKKKWTSEIAGTR